MLEWIISASVLIAVILICRHFFKGHVSCRIQYGLWLLVALRLLVPISPVQSPLSVANLLPENWAQPRVERVQNLPPAVWVPSPDPKPEDSQPVLTENSQSILPEGSRPVLTENSQSVLPADNPAVVPMGSEELRRPGFPEDGDSSMNTGPKFPVDTMGALWLAGSCALALWLLTVNGAFRYRVRRDRQRQEIPGELHRELSAYSGRGRKVLPIYVTDQVGAPCMYGLFCPAIYITSQVAADPWLLSMVLRHEQTHYRHRDHIWAVVRTLCLCVHWYNPLVWTAVALSRQDGELACDENVLRRLGEENRGSYGEALLTLAAGVRPALPGAVNLATSMSGTRRQLKERLSALVTAPRMAAGTAAFILFLSLGLAACTFTSRADNHEDRQAAGKLSAQRSGLETAGSQEEGAFTDAETLPESGENASEPEQLQEPIYDIWNAQILEYRNEEYQPVAEIVEGEKTTKLTYVETSWSLSAESVQYSREILYWACQALRELEQWTGTEVTEVCYSVSEFGDFSFAQTPGDMRHDRVFYSRCYGDNLFGNSNVIEQISYATDMDVWFSPVKQYVTPPRYDRMTTEEILIWYFERSAIARDCKVEEILQPWGDDYVIRTDQGTYYEYFPFMSEAGTVGRGMSLYGPYDSYPLH